MQLVMVVSVQKDPTVQLELTAVATVAYAKLECAILLQEIAAYEVYIHIYWLLC